MADWIGRQYTSTTGWKHTERLVDLDGRRMAGTKSERAAAEATREAFSEAGAWNARIEEFEIMDWRRGTSSVTHPNSGTSHECLALPRSPVADVTGDLVDVGYGTPATFEKRDVNGSVVIASTGAPSNEWVHRWEKYRAAVRNDAAALILYNHLTGNLPRSGAIRGSDGQPIGEIPAVGTSLEVGKRLIRRFEGEPVTVEVDARTGEATSRNIHAELGPDTRAQVVVSCHIDSHDISEGAQDNAVGAGVVVEVAEALAARENELDRRVHLIGFGAEEMGFLGSAHAVNRMDLDSVTVVLQNDGIARERDLLLYTNGFDGLKEVTRGVGERFPDPVSVTHELSLDSDHWRFVERGIPSYAVASETPAGQSALGSSSGIPVTPADTFDKIDPRDLRSQAIIETELIIALADERVTLPHSNPEEIRARLDAEEKRELARTISLSGKEGGLVTPDW